MRGSFAILLPQTTVLLSFLFEVFKHKTFIGKLTKFSYIPRFDYTKKNTYKVTFCFGHHIPRSKMHEMTSLIILRLQNI